MPLTSTPDTQQNNCGAWSLNTPTWTQIASTSNSQIRPIRKIDTPNGQLASVYDVIDAIKGRSCNARTEFGRLVKRYHDVVANCYDAKLFGFLGQGPNWSLCSLSSMSGFRNQGKLPADKRGFVVTRAG